MGSSHVKKEQVMPTGTVKWFNNAKGFGFILPESGGEDLFAHYSSIEMDGYKTLKAGQMVDFEVIQGQKGMHATNIRVSNSESPNTSSKASTSTQNRSENSQSRTLTEEHA